MKRYSYKYILKNNTASKQEVLDFLACGICTKTILIGVFPFDVADYEAAEKTLKQYQRSAREHRVTYIVTAKGTLEIRAKAYELSRS